MTARGGARPGAGRKKGSKDKRSKECQQALRKVAEKVEQVLGPKAFKGDAHALLVLLYKDPEQPLVIRLDAAKAAIGYEKPRLAAIEAQVGGTLNVISAEPVESEEAWAAKFGVVAAA